MLLPSIQLLVHCSCSQRRCIVSKLRSLAERDARSLLRWRSRTNQSFCAHLLPQKPAAEARTRSKVSWYCASPLHHLQQQKAMCIQGDLHCIMHHCQKAHVVSKVSREAFQKEADDPHSDLFRIRPSSHSGSLFNVYVEKWAMFGDEQAVMCLLWNSLVYTLRI